MNNNMDQLIQVKAKKLGVLLYDARIAARKKVEDCASLLSIPPNRYQEYEGGTMSPSLPEIESIAYFFNIPLDHFFASTSISNGITKNNGEFSGRLLRIRNRMIAIHVRMAREKAGFTLAELANLTSISEVKLTDYEAGDPIPLSELNVLADKLGINLEDLIDQKGPVGVWRQEKSSFQKYEDLPEELKHFISKPINQPYLELAIKLSKLPAVELRQIAENILQITL